MAEMYLLNTDTCADYGGKVGQHDYELYLVINDIDHTKTKVGHPQTNGVCEWFKPGSPVYSRHVFKPN